jgi:hypothetical protein
MDVQIPPATDVGAEATKVPGGRELSFIDGLIGHLEARKVKDGMRALRCGVFVDEILQADLIVAYRSWLSSVQGGNVSPSDEKCMRRLFNSEQPELFYLLDGNRCIPGFLIAADGTLERNRFPLVWSQAPLMDATNYLHPRDRVLTETPGVALGHGTGKGFYLEIVAGAQRFRIEEKALQRFAACVRDSSALLKEFPEMRGALRYAISPLQRVLKNATLVPANQRILVPALLRTNKDITLFRYQSLVLVLNKQSALLDCFEPRGKSLREFIERELELAGAKRVGTFELTPRDRRFVGKIKIKSKYFQLHRKAFFEVVRTVGVSPTLRKQLKGRYTVIDCLKELEDVLRCADWVSYENPSTAVGPSKQSKSKQGKQNKPKRRLQFGSWTFVTGEKFSILACEERRPGALPQREKRPAQKKRGRDQPRSAKP